MAKRKTEWREWVVFCEGVGPIARTNGSMRRVVQGMKERHWPDNDLYSVKRVRVTLDPEKR